MQRKAVDFDFTSSHGRCPRAGALVRWEMAAAVARGLTGKFLIASLPKSGYEAAASLLKFKSTARAALMGLWAPTKPWARAGRINFLKAGAMGVVACRGACAR